MRPVKWVRSSFGRLKKSVRPQRNSRTPMGHSKSQDTLTRLECVYCRNRRTRLYQNNLFGSNINRLRPLWTFLDLENDRLILNKCFESIHVNLRIMDKNIASIIHADKTKTLLLVKPFYFSFWH